MGLTMHFDGFVFRMIAGWKLADNMEESHVRDLLVMARLKRGAKWVMIIHSYRDGQYLSRKLKKVIKTFKLRQSMFSADNPFNNAWAESFWTGPPGGRMKAELDMPKGGCEGIKKLKSVLFEYIDGYYNSQRLHSSLNYLNPVAFEEEYYRQTG